MEVQIQAWHRSNALSRKLEKIPGIGPLTASALVASIGDAKGFENGRQLAAWLGLVPKQHSSGGKQTLLGISKRGDCYLRTLLIHGARAVIYAAQRKLANTGWLASLLARRDKISLRLRWRTRTREPCGHSWHTIESSGPITPGRNQTG
jgi:transposase